MRAALALGSNLGDRLAHLRQGLAGLRQAGEIVAVSPVYETDPVGPPGQQDYLNAVVVVETPLTARNLLLLGQRLENEAHRVRTVSNGPRTLDVDVLAYGDQTVGEPDLVVPHPRAHERGFVLVPWAAADPDFMLVGHGKVRALAAAVGAQGVRTRADLSLTASAGDVRDDADSRSADG